jgi:energy-coupling factor transporter ATP-binding protein EcfA2
MVAQGANRANDVSSHAGDTPMKARIAGVGIANFRGIRDRVSISPLGRINVLAGPNNSGKSTLLEAIRLLYEPILTGDSYRTGSVSLDTLDSPDYFDHGVWTDIRPELGLLLEFGGGQWDPAMDFIRVATLDAKNNLQGNRDRDHQRMVAEFESERARHSSSRAE